MTDEDAEDFYETHDLEDTFAALMAGELPKSECPRCGAEQEDADGFGVLFCEVCKWCAHPASTDGKCDLCGKPDAP